MRWSSVPQGPRRDPAEVMEVYNSSHRIECYYLMNADHNVAIGWVHNLNAWTMNNFYLANTDTTQNFLGCASPFVDWQWIDGFQPGLDYHVTWFPTRMDTTALPLNYVDSTGNGSVMLDLSTAPLGDTLNNFLDTLHADYAFIVSVNPVTRNMAASDEAEVAGASGWDFTLYPNPASNEIFIGLPDDAPKEVVLYDLAGRRLRIWPNVTGPMRRIAMDELAKGAYYVQVADRSVCKVKKLIIR